MKATGIVRRIDELGRVVVPKEIRRTLKIREGDSLEIFTDSSGEIILKKYSPIGEMTEFAKMYVEAISNATGHTVIITDRDMVIAAAGNGKNDLLGKVITKQLENVIDERVIYNSELNKTIVKIVENMPIDEGGEIICPIICEGDVIGAVIIISKVKGKMNEIEIKLGSVAAGFLAKQMEN